MENRYTNLKVGLITTVGFIVLIILFTWKSGSIIKFSGYEIIGEFDNVGGLLETADVRYRGYNVGKVMQIVPGPEVIKVYVKIKDNVLIPDDSRLRIAFDGLIGQKYLDVVPGSSKNFLKSGKSIPGITSAGIVDFIDEGAKSMQEVQKVLIYVRKFLETQEFQAHITNSAKNLDQLTSQLKGYGPKVTKVVDDLNSLVSNLNKIAADSLNQENIKSTLADAKASSEKLNKILESIEQLTDNPDNKANIEKIIKNLKTITDDLSGESGGENKGNGITKSLQNLKRLSDLKIGVNATLLANPEHKLATGRAGLDLSFSPKSTQYHFKLKEDIKTKEISMFSVTGENYLNDQFTYHYGIIDSHLGAGLTYDFNERIQLLTEIYQPSDVKANVQAAYALNPNWQVIAAAEKINKSGSDGYVGVGFKK